MNAYINKQIIYIHKNRHKLGITTSSSLDSSNLLFFGLPRGIIFFSKMKLFFVIPAVSSLIIFIILVRFTINYIKHKKEHKIPSHIVFFAFMSTNVFL